MFIDVGEAKVATKVASTGMDVAQMADKVSDVAKAADKISDVAKVTEKVSDVAKVADKAVDLGRYQASLKGLGKKLAQNIDEGILTQGRAFSDSIDNLISAMNKHTSTPYPAYAGLGKLDDVGKTADKFEDWYSSVKKSMMKTDSTGGSGVKVSGPVDELNPKALNETEEQIAKGVGKAVKQKMLETQSAELGGKLPDGTNQAQNVINNATANGTVRQYIMLMVWQKLKRV